MTLAPTAAILPSRRTIVPFGIVPRVTVTSVAPLSATTPGRGCAWPAEARDRERNESEGRPRGQMSTGPDGGDSQQTSSDLSTVAREASEGGEGEADDRRAGTVARSSACGRLLLVLSAACLAWAAVVVGDRRNPVADLRASCSAPATRAGRSRSASSCCWCTRSLFRRVVCARHRPARGARPQSAAGLGAVLRARARRACDSLRHRSRRAGPIRAAT